MLPRVPGGFENSEVSESNPAGLVQTQLPTVPKYQGQTSIRWDFLNDYKSHILNLAKGWGMTMQLVWTRATGVGLVPPVPQFVPFSIFLNSGGYSCNRS